MGIQGALFSAGCVLRFNTLVSVSCVVADVICLGRSARMRALKWERARDGLRRARELGTNAPITPTLRVLRMHSKFEGAERFHVRDSGGRVEYKVPKGNAVPPAKASGKPQMWSSSRKRHRLDGRRVDADGGP